MAIVATKADQIKTHEMLREVTQLLHILSDRLDVPLGKVMGMAQEKGAGYSWSPSESASPSKPSSRKSSPSRGRRVVDNEHHNGLARIYHKNKKMLMVSCRPPSPVNCAIHAHHRASFGVLMRIVSAV